MSAKYTIRKNTKDQFLEIPINLTHSNLGQEDIVENEFVEKEVNKAINEIVDYEKLRLSPYNGTKAIGRVDYSINLLKDKSFPELTTMKSVGFENDDIKFRRNNFKKSFLNLMFFDSDIPTQQNLLSYNTIYNKLTRFDMMNTTPPEIVEVEQPEETPEETTFNFDFNFGPTELEEGIIEGTHDDSITKGLLVAQKCNSIVFSQKMNWYVNGLSYKVVYKPVGVGETCADYPEMYVGDKVTGSEAGIPTGFFDTIYLVDSSYEYNNKTYKVYTKWTTNFIFGGKTFINVYFKDVSNDDGNGVGTTPPTNPILYGNVKDVSEIPLNFMVENPIITPRGFAEGYYLYHNINDLPTSIYMRANYVNAKSGIVTDLVTSKEPQSIENIVSKLHTKYDLKIIGDNYYYQLDTNYSDNVVIGENGIKINLFEIQVL